MKRSTKVGLGFGGAVLAMCGIAGCLASAIDPSFTGLNGPATPVAGPSPSRTTQISEQPGPRKPSPSFIPLPTEFDDGVWVVGEDIAPGTYKTKTEVTSGFCYWAILRSGTNGSKVLNNDAITGGIPRINVVAGHDVKTQGCGSWVHVK